MDKNFDHIKIQDKTKNLWEKENIYQFDNISEKECFSIDSPPPGVSGTLHIGHIFSYTHTDIIARYKRLKGFNVFYPMGFDDNGLPTERFVEKKHKTKAHLMKRSEFIKLCLKETKIVEKEFEDLWKKMGFSIDWNQTYSTISDKVQKISQYSFIELYEKNLIEQKEEPSLYCTTCRTSVAQAELDSQEISTTFNDIEFETEDGEKLTISTTRPELLPACVAIFFNPDDTRYKHLEKKIAITPIFKNKITILPDKLVDKDKGSGLVMCCTFGDQTDILWYKKHKLPIIQAIELDGKWTKKTGVLEGLKVQEARKKILELLKTEQKLLNQKKITHAVNTHERCKQEIEYIVLKQWFIKILKHKKIFIDNAEKINWKPDFMKARYKDWVENLGWDWCISRQRFYGVPVPVWHCEDCSKVILANKQKLPVDPQEIIHYESCPECNGKNIIPDTDVMDTWATSSLTPQINIGWPKDSQIIKMPMHMRAQAHDIIRTWAFYTIVKAHYHNNNIPWKDIVISGHVLAGKEKFSKSKGEDRLAPENLLKTYPVDVIRYWSAQGRLGTDTAFSENQFKIGQRLLIKLWNAMRFCSEHIKDFSKSTNTPNDNLAKWILHEFSQTTKNYIQKFDQYEYTHALENIEKFFWNHFCDNYLELIKDQIFNPDKYTKEIIADTQFTLYEIGFGILQLLAPFIPYITEELYQQLFKDKEGEKSIHITKLEQQRFSYSYPESANTINNVIKIVSQIRKLKTENQLSLKVEIEKLEIHSADKKLAEELKKQERIILGVSKTQKIEYSDQAINESKMEKIDDKWIIKLQF
ncbi:valine--tRNA ligase [Candidatus Babeliales bacterium]|nr:valine--tRNA ligase [Candidatus Babeliales bacterium]